MSAPATEPSARAPRSRWRRRLLDVLPAVLIGAGVAGFIIAFLIGGGGDDENIEDRNPVIEALIPARDSEVLKQSQVGIDLESGFDAQLFLNDVPIPIDQVNILRGDDPEDQLPAGDDTNSLSRFVFQPGPGKEITELQADENCARAEFWPLSDPSDVSSIEWCFTAA